MPRALDIAAQAIRAGADIGQTNAVAIEAIKAAGFSTVDYFALADAATLEVLSSYDGRPARLLAAAKIGKTRLIDNLAL